MPVGIRKQRCGVSREENKKQNLEEKEKKEEGKFLGVFEADFHTSLTTKYNYFCIASGH